MADKEPPAVWNRHSGKMSSTNRGSGLDEPNHGTSERRGSHSLAQSRWGKLSHETDRRGIKGLSIDKGPIGHNL
eukprot:scaffold835_cov133-Cylindrotheca_fusiformis.AAC.1